MEECNEVTNQNEGSSELGSGDYFELILSNHDIEHEGSTGRRSSPPIPPRKSPKSRCLVGPRTIGKPRALPPPASSAIQNDSILRNCDHSNQTATPPPLPAKTYDTRGSSRNSRLVDKGVQCSSNEEFMQDINHNASRAISIEDRNKQRIVRADGLLVVSTPTNIILTQSNSVQTIVLTPNELNSNTSVPRMIVLQSKTMPIHEEESGIVEDRTRSHQINESTSIGTSSRLVLESLAPSLTRSQSRGCANEYVGDPVACKKPLFKKYNKKVDSTFNSSQVDEITRKGRGLVCQKCLKCKCNQCKINGDAKKDVARKTSQLDTKAYSEKTKEDAGKESTRELLVSLRDDGKIVTRGILEERLEEARTEGEGNLPSCRRGTPSFLLQCFSIICCCSWNFKHNCCTWVRSSDGCQCDEEEEPHNLEEDDEVFLSSNS